jgi:peptidoglycan-associated lipoprotein
MGVTAPQPESPIAPATPPPPTETTPVSPTIAVSEEVLAACKLNLDAVEKAPKFGFDQSALQVGDAPVLVRIADCFTTGPMKDSAIVLVGHTDPRGSAAYNEALGLKRAQAVATYLQKLGVPAERIQSTSRGKLDARGTEEGTWAIDRRVDVGLGQ